MNGRLRPWPGEASLVSAPSRRAVVLAGSGPVGSRRCSEVNVLLASPAPNRLVCPDTMGACPVICDRLERPGWRLELGAGLEPVGAGSQGGKAPLPFWAISSA